MGGRGLIFVGRDGGVEVVEFGFFGFFVQVFGVIIEPDGAGIVFLGGVDERRDPRVCGEDLWNGDVSVFGEDFENVFEAFVPPFTVFWETVFVETAAFGWGDFEGGEESAFERGQVGGVFVEIELGGVFYAVDVGSEFDDVEVEFKDSGFWDVGEHVPGDEGFFEFSGEVFVSVEEEIFGELLSDGGTAVDVFSLIEIESERAFDESDAHGSVFEEALVFGEEHGGFDVGRDFIERGVGWGAWTDLYGVGEVCVCGGVNEVFVV